MKRDDLPEFARIPEVARLLGMSESAVWRMVWIGELPSARLSERVVRIPRTELLAWLQDRVAAGSTSA